MGNFEGVRKELGIESRDERKARLRTLRKDEARIMRMVRQVLRDLRQEIFPEHRIRKMEEGGLAISHEAEVNPPGARGGKKSGRRKVWVYDVAVNAIVDDPDYPVTHTHLECWRELSGNAPIGSYPGERPPSVLCEIDRRELVQALKQLVMQYPP